jgi:opacity protein-like surface antigen
MLAMKRHKLCLIVMGALLATGSQIATSATATNPNLYHRFFASIGAGYTWSNNATFTDGDAKGAPYLPLYGLPKYYSTGNFGHSPNFSIEVGYRFHPALIPSISLNYIPSVNFSGNANYAKTGSIQPVSSSGHSISLMLNNTVDLYDLFKLMNPSLKASRIHPVVGAGIGISNNYNSSQVQYFPELGTNAYTSLPSASTMNFAYNLSAGLVFQLAKSTFLEADYLYMHLGKMKTGSGSMLVYNHGCGKGGETCARAIDETQANYNTQGILLKLTHVF